MKVIKHDRPLESFEFISGNLYQNLASSNQNIYVYSNNLDEMMVDLETGYALYVCDLNQPTSWVDVTKHYRVQPI